MLYQKNEKETKPKIQIGTALLRFLSSQSSGISPLKQAAGVYIEVLCDPDWREPVTCSDMSVFKWDNKVYHSAFYW